MTTTVIDLSHHNKVTTNLFDAKRYPIEGVIHKATEGKTVVDEKLSSRYHLAKEADLLFGVYHFVRPGNMKEQVDFFINITDSLGVPRETTLYALDYEVQGVSIPDVIEFMQYLEQNIEASPVIYSGHLLKEKITPQAVPVLSKYRLWLAQYGPKPVMPMGWSNYFLWQYTDKGTVPGIAGPVDLNKYDHSYDLLKLEWAGRSLKASPPAPVTGVVAEDKVVEVNLDIKAPSGVRVDLKVNGKDYLPK